MAAALFLFISAIAIWWSAIQFGDRLLTPQPPRPKAAAQPPVAVELDRAAEQLQQPAQWKASTRSGLFVPEKHFIGADGLPATLQNTEVHAPVPNDWFEKYGLPIEDAGVLDRSEEHTSELQSRPHLVCRLLLEKKKKLGQTLICNELIVNELDLSWIDYYSYRIIRLSYYSVLVQHHHNRFSTI